MKRRESFPRPLTEKELAILRSNRDRQERYFRTALFVQSKWFMIGGSVAVAVFLIIMLLLAS
jgi:hypothetical protein